MEIWNCRTVRTLETVEIGSLKTWEVRFLNAPCFPDPPYCAQFQTVVERVEMLLEVQTDIHLFVHTNTPTYIQKVFQV